MTNDFRIEKSRVEVAVTTIDGERLVGDMFLQPYSTRRTGPESPADVLNDADPYFPLALENGETMLIAKDRLREVEVPVDEGEREADEYTAAGVRYAAVELVLVGGVTRSGSVRLELPFERPRLLDFLNRYQLRFLMLFDDDGIRLLNRRCIERVRPLD